MAFYIINNTAIKADSPDRALKLYNRERARSKPIIIGKTYSEEK